MTIQELLQNSENEIVRGINPDNIYEKIKEYWHKSSDSIDILVKYKWKSGMGDKKFDKWEKEKWEEHYKYDNVWHKLVEIYKICNPKEKYYDDYIEKYPTSI